MVASFWVQLISHCRVKLESVSIPLFKIFDEENSQKYIPIYTHNTHIGLEVFQYRSGNLTPMLEKVALQ